MSLDRLASTRAVVHYSDDRGATWHTSPVVSTPKGSTGRKTNPAAEEPMIVELKDGRLMMFIRTYLKSIFVSYSSDGGATWTEPVSSGVPSPGSMSTIRRMPTGDLLLIWNWARVEDISGPWPRNFLSTAISKDEGRTFTSVRHLDGAEDFGGKITMANLIFNKDGNAVITYSKSMNMKNAYNWRLQVIPVQWFYEGDMTQVYGEPYVPVLEEKIAGLGKAATRETLLMPRPSNEGRTEARAALSDEQRAEAKTPDLVAAYYFETDQGRFVFDASPNANDLAINARNGSPKWADSRAGRSLQFDGGGGCLAAPDSPSLRIESGVFTLEALVYPSEKKEFAIIATKEHQFELGILRGKLQGAVRSGGSWGPGWVGDADVPLKEWSRVAMTFDKRRIRLYLNGNCVTDVPRLCTMTATDELFVVGNCTNIDDAGFAGHIDELKLWQCIRYGGQENAEMDEATRKPRPVGAAHQLWVDDSLIAELNGLERVVNQPVKHHLNPVLTYEKPWEGNCVITWGSVLYDEESKRFKVWYEAYKKFAEDGDNTVLCYAESKDGLTWEKPSLGVVDYLGSTDNNIVLWEKDVTVDAPTVLKAANPAPGCKYRMYYYCAAAHGIRTGTSPDGIQWTIRDGAVVEAGDRSSVYYDHGLGKYRLITRIPGRKERTCGLWESSDGEHFEAVGEILAADDTDPEGTQLYGMVAFEYEGMRLGFLEPFFIPRRILDTQLAYSADGYSWQRACERQTFLSCGPAGSWDRAWVTPSHNAPIRVGDQLYIFYQGRQTLHWAERPYGHIGGIGLAIMRPDGFVSLDAVYDEGVVTTAPLLLTGSRLHINAHARPGYVIAEIVGLDRSPLPGFARDACVPCAMSDTLDHTFVWKEGRDLKSLADTPVRIRFFARGAKLYSFWVE